MPQVQGVDSRHRAIEDPAVIRRILEHLGLWASRAMQRRPPLRAEAWPVHATSLPLTDHPVPDIA
jgi:hypothetical protein